MARTMSATERTARDAIKPYVRAGHLTQHEANKIIRDGLALTAEAVRTNLAKGHGSAFYYARKTAEARKEYDRARGQAARFTTRGRMLACEVFEAVYKSVRADFKTAEEIEAEDAEAPRLLTALEIVKEEADAAAARIRPGLFNAA